MVKTQRRGEWTREGEAAALARLAAGTAAAPPAVLAYTRQSVSDFDDSGRLRGPSLEQQLDAVRHRPELQGLPLEVFQDADRSGGETSKRRDYLRLMERIRKAQPGEIGAVACSDIDRLHRNDVEFFRFMAEMAEREILVFDATGLISSVDQLPWKVRAIVAQEERVKIARRVRDNLRYLKRNGHLLGVIPQGYRRVDGTIVEDPESAPIVKQIFALYGTGEYSFQTLADHLNREGVRPTRGPSKAKHNRPAAVIFTGDVLKDILDNPTYLGKVKVDGELIEGKHPALIEQATWDACVAVRQRNRRHTSKTWTRHSYPLTPLLRCGRCGSTMHGEVASGRSGTRRYYACHAARRQRAATHLPLARCDSKAIRSERIEAAIRDELQRCVPSDDLHEAYRAELERRLGSAAAPRDVTEARLRRLDEQLARLRQLYEYGEYDWETFLRKRADIQHEQKRLREEAAATRGDGDHEWCRARLLDVVATWDAADEAQRTRLLSALFETLEAEALPQRGLRIVAVPRAAWRDFFQLLALELQTGACSNSEELQSRLRELLRRRP